MIHAIDTQIGQSASYKTMESSERDHGDEIKKENTELCDSKANIKLELKVEDCDDFGQDKDSQIKDDITKKIYSPYDLDDDDDEPCPPPKLRKFIHSDSRIGKHEDKTGLPTKTFEDAPKCKLEVKSEPCEDVQLKTEQPTIQYQDLGPGSSLKSSIKQESETSKKAVVKLEDGHSTSSANVIACHVTDRLNVHWHNQSNGGEGSQQMPSDGLPVFYVHSDELIEQCNCLPRILDRAGMVHSLIESVGLLSFLQVVAPETADQEEVMKFHSVDYIEYLKRISHLEDEEQIDSEESDHYGITYDCPVQKGVYDCAALVAGATVVAAKALRDGQCHIAINWCGGWHHAQKSEASGFCYINDIVLGILILRNRFSRVLYVDLDVHHGDGVENAFSTTPHVLTVSFHKYDPGFFPELIPGTGSINDVGSGRGKYYSINVPMKDGLCDKDFFGVFKCVMTHVRESYSPEVVVCQCGADGLAGDPMSSFNLTLTAYRHCLFFLMLWKLPLLLLGGGGYHHANTARLWASLTALTVGRKLPQDVPDHRHFTEYGPDYELTMQAGNRKNHNSLDDLNHICNIIAKNLQKIKDKPV